MSPEQRQAILDHLGRHGGLRCLQCRSGEITSIHIFRPTKGNAADYGLPEGQQAVFGLCKTCEHLPFSDILELLALRLVPAHKRN